MSFLHSLPVLALATLAAASAVSDAGSEGGRDARRSDAAFSNILPEDYVGPETCGDCHEGNYAAWREHPHSRMNLNPSEETVLGDFSGTSVVYGNGRVVFEREGEGYFMSLHRDRRLHRRYRVTRTVGSRFTQMYIGTQVHGPEPMGDPAYSLEAKLPFGYSFRLGRWLPTTYFDSDREPDYAAGTGSDDSFENVVYDEPASHLWEANCILCHNTYPYEYRLYLDAMEREFRPSLTGFPAEDLELSPNEAQAREIRAREWKARYVEPEELVTLGISCESCHFGGREHAREERAIRFVPAGPGLDFPRGAEARPASAERQDPYVVNSICAQCHCADISLHPNGAGTWNSRESLDMAGGACASAIKCTDCHDPHIAGPPGRSPDRPEHVAACVSCHPQYAEASAREAHSRHTVSAGVSCLDCHMPRMVQGLEDVVRTHMISSPTDPRMLGEAAPNACNLCHLDKSVAWTLSELREGWGARVESPPTAEAYGGDLDRPVGDVWLRSEVPQLRLVAVDAYAHGGDRAAAIDRLLSVLQDPVAVNRFFALMGLEKVLGRHVGDDEYNPLAPPWYRSRQVSALRVSLP